MSRKSAKPGQPKSETMNKARLAVHFGVTTKVVERWISEGMPVLSVPNNRNGEYQISTAAAWRWHLERLAASDGELSLDAERARLAKEQADGQALKNERLRDSLLPAAEVVGAWEMAQASARRICGAMVDRVVPTLLADINAAPSMEGAERAVRERLTKAIDGALSELASTTFNDEGEEEVDAPDRISHP